ASAASDDFSAVASAHAAASADAVVTLEVVAGLPPPELAAHAPRISAPATAASRRTGIPVLRVRMTLSSARRQGDSSTAPSGYASTSGPMLRRHIATAPTPISTGTPTVYTRQTTRA